MMRTREQIKVCKDGHRGTFIKINDKLVRCEACGGIIGSELAKK
jgi:hypothetical protein